MSLQETVKSNPIYKEMQILKLEDIVLQNNCLFGYHHLLQKSLSETFDNYFHKTTDHHGHNIRGEKFIVPITKSWTYVLRSITSSSIKTGIA